MNKDKTPKTKKQLKKRIKALKNELAEAKLVNDAIKNTLDSYARHYDDLNKYIIFLLDTNNMWSENNTFTFPDGQSLLKVQFDDIQVMEMGNYDDLKSAIEEATEAAMQTMKDMDAEETSDERNDTASTPA